MVVLCFDSVQCSFHYRPASESCLLAACALSNITVLMEEMTLPIVITHLFS